MSARLYVGWFEEEARTLRAVASARQAGFAVHDVYAPYAVHGIDEAMGLPPSRLTWVCFAAGLAGLLFAAWLQHFTSAVSWPLNVGGKPFDSAPAFVPICFELTVLSAALVTVAALFVRSRLFAGSRRRALPRVTDDRFAVALETRGGHFDEREAAELLAREGAIASDFEEVER